MIQWLDGSAAVTVETFGGKAVNLNRLYQGGWAIPPSLGLSTYLYRDYLQTTGLSFRLQLELGRKPLAELRWEELWDLAIRIRTAFLGQPFPESLSQQLFEAIPKAWLRRPLVVRSSAPQEDQQELSFAGLHESRVWVVGESAVLKAIQAVWASLWSERALMYRKELDLAPKGSRMAVIIQPVIVGRTSGILFTRSPNDPGSRTIEAVYGLNEGLVDGSIEPDRWHLDGETGEILEHRAPSNRSWMRTDGHRSEVLPAGLVGRPLNPARLKELHRLSCQLEETFDGPQDVEWTLCGNDFILLQSRPITTPEHDPERSWYLSLTPSIHQLEVLRREIEQQLLPALRREANDLLQTDIVELNDQALLEHLEFCRTRLTHWEQVYRDKLIPMAHGIRLFGQMYNDRICPRDSFEFTRILRGSSLLALKRNRLLAQVARLPTSRQSMEIEQLRPRFEALGVPGEIALPLVAQGPDAFVSEAGRDEELESRFLANLGPEEETMARQMIDLGRTAWRLRDDDNLYMDRLREPFRQTVREMKQRLERNPTSLLSGVDLQMPQLSLPKSQFESPPPEPVPSPSDWGQEKRQLVGQPASPGVARGTARLIHNRNDMSRFQAGEVLVCDALDPTLTLIAPLAAAIVERRGGMLIHGAIIAREYGIPCVTGIPEATRVIRDGDRLTIDGHLGIVIRATTG